MSLVGRARERAELRHALTSSRAELVAVYGRRRVGKTFLIREAYGADIAFELVGLHDAPLPVQLQTFATSLARASGGATPLAAPATWYQAFDQLAELLRARLKHRKRKLVVFLDEIPWLASRRSHFLSAFEHFWNGWASREPRLVVVICGSAASWMLHKVVRERGGLHNRVTRRVRLEPFSLGEASELLRANGVSLGPYQTAELYMALGGVPHYLSQVHAGESAAQCIDRLCFARDGFLRTEFADLYAALFDKAERHEAVVRALASHRRGMSRGPLLAAAGLETGGASSKVLDELEESGFVMRSTPIGRKQREAVYWLADEYSLFYLTWIERHRQAGSPGIWLGKQGTPAWRVWSGLAFEAVCLKHVAQIKRALGIAGVATETGSWEHRGDERADGAQIDLVIDRADRSTNLCEMKFSEGEFAIDKAYARALAHKRDAFRTITKTRKALFVTLVTTYGVRDNEHARRLGVQAVTLDALFAAP